MSFRPYTINEENIIRDFFSVLPQTEMVMRLPNRNWSSICSKAYRMGIEAHNNQGSQSYTGKIKAFFDNSEYSSYQYETRTLRSKFIQRVKMNIVKTKHHRLYFEIYPD